MFRRALGSHAAKLQAVRQFLLAQGATVAGNLVYGLLCVRLLDPASYAQFVVLFAVQGTFVILMDVGISGSLIPLIGEEVGNRHLIADYLASLRHLSRRIYAGLALCLTIAYPLLVRNRHWSPRIVAAMVAILLLSTWFMRIGSSYGAVLILLQERSIWYRGQMISSLGTLGILLLLWAVHQLGAFSAILTNVAGIVFVGCYYLSHARRLLGTAGRASVEKQKAILRLALPNVPGIIFYALQGQIALFLITVFGRTAGVASIGALSRLGQIFVLFSQMNVLLVEPFFARLPKNRLWRNYAGVLAITGSVCVAVVAVACLFPGLFLLILGPSYSGLRYEVKIVIASSSISYFTNVLWSIHSARRFIYWWNNIMNIVLTLIVQAVFIWKADLTTVRSVVLLNLATVVAAVFTNALSGTYGYVRGPRRTGMEDASSATVQRSELILAEGKA